MSSAIYHSIILALVMSISVQEVCAGQKPPTCHRKAVLCCVSTAVACMICHIMKLSPFRSTATSPYAGVPLVPLHESHIFAVYNLPDFRVKNSVVDKSRV